MRLIFTLHSFALLLQGLHTTTALIQNNAAFKVISSPVALPTMKMADLSQDKEYCNSISSVEKQGIIGRRDFFQQISSFFVGAATSSVVWNALPERTNAEEEVLRSPRPLVYSIEWTDPPNMQPYTKKGEKRILKKLASRPKAVVLGEKHNAQEDQLLAVDLIEKMLKERGGKNVAIGLEMIQQKCQPALDAYLAKEIPDLAAADEALYEQTEWATTWPWPIEQYLPVLHLARSKGLPLIALNTDKDVMDKVKQQGLEALTDQEKQKFVSDPQGFIGAVRDQGFKWYTEMVILPGYERQAAAGMLGPNPTQRNFFAARILWDEAIASRINSYISEHPKELVVALVGSDHVKHGFGVGWRLERLLGGDGSPIRDDGTDREKKRDPWDAPVKNILLNPTAKESGSYGVPKLNLVIGYAEKLEYLRPLADFVWFSKSPRVSLISRMMDPIN